MNETSSRIIEDFNWLSAPREDAFGLWFWIGGFLLLVLVAVVVFFVLRKKNVPLPFFAPPLPHEIALKALRELGVILREEHDLEFVKKASHILRVYIQDRFGLRAPHRSTEEFLHEARLSELLDEDHQRLLAGFLAQCDLAKFARQRVAITQMQALFQSARSFVEGTAPREEPAVAK